MKFKLNDLCIYLVRNYHQLTERERRAIAEVVIRVEMYQEDMLKLPPEELKKVMQENGEETKAVATVSMPVQKDSIEELKPLFYNNEADVKIFLKEIDGMPPNDITDLVNQWVQEKRISDYGNSRKGTLWEILKDAGLYNKSRQNWCRRVY